MICGSEAQKKDMCKWDICLFIYRQKKECVIDRLETRGNRGFFARPNSPRRTNTIPLSPVTGITLKKICYATIFAVADTSPFFIGYTALNILYIQGLLHATPYVFKFYADICQVQDFFYLVTYIICRKNIVFDEKKKNFYFFILCAYIRRTIKYVNLSDTYLDWPRFYALLW